jgi:hypothetical protein
VNQLLSRNVSLDERTARGPTHQSTTTMMRFPSPSSFFGGATFEKLLEFDRGSTCICW